MRRQKLCPHRYNDLHMSEQPLSLYFTITLGLLTVLLIAVPAGADIVVPLSSVTEYAKVLFPADTMIFTVPNEYATIDITALGETLISYKARASLDLWPFTGKSTGGTLFHRVEFWFDDQELPPWTTKEYVANAPDGEEGEWVSHSVEVGPDVLHLTKTCGVGSYVIGLSHEVFDARRVIHAFEPAFSTFYVVPVPAPGAVLLGIVGLLYSGLRLRRRTT